MRIFVGIFFCSLSAISYEIALTRIFSISLSYHFAFMVVSIAMLGIGISGTLLSVYPRLKSEPMLGKYALYLSASIPLSYIISNLIPFDPARLSWDSTGLLYIPAYYAVLSTPFLFFGLIVSASLSLRSKESGFIYGADMLGAGIGSLAVMLLMAKVSTEMSVFFISIAGAGGALLLRRPKAGIIIAVLNLLIILINPDFTHIRMSPYKGLQLALKYPSAEHLKTYHSGFARIDLFQSPMVRFAPGLSLKYLHELPEQIGVSIDGADINAITKADKKTAGFLSFLPASLPYELRKNCKDVLLIEPRAGLHVLLARHYSSRNIYKVDSNPLLIDIIRDDLRDFSGGIYNENTHKGLGRGKHGFMPDKGRAPDIIDIPLMGAMPSGMFGIKEDYRFTVEAFREYLGYMKEDGLLSLSMFIIPPPRTELRLLSTAIKAMEEADIKDVENHIAAIRSWGSICMLISRRPFYGAEITAIKDFARQRNFDLIYYPGIKEEETNIYVKMPSNDYYVAFKKLISQKTRDSFKKDYIFDIAEVYDDSPFFHYHLRLGNLSDIYKVMGRKWQYFIEEGYLLPLIFVQVLVISLMLIVLPYIRTVSKGGIRGEDGKGLSSVVFYFAFLGIGYMFFEVPLIQKMILPLEQPPNAVAIVLSSVLISSGIGGIFSKRHPKMASPYAVAILASVIVIYSLVLPYAITAISAYPLYLKVILSFILIMPPGILMGIPFPLGIRLLGQRQEMLIPWAWAVNGCFSVLGPILSIIIAMAAGFRFVMLMAAVAYLMAFVLLRGSMTGVNDPS